MVEVQNHDIGLAAAHTRMGLKVVSHVLERNQSTDTIPVHDLFPHTLMVLCVIRLRS